MTRTMTKRYLGLLTPLALLATMTVHTPAAGAAELRANIPFAFTVNGANLPAGTYTLSESGSALFVQGATGGAVVLTNRTESSQHMQPSLVFNRYGDQYVLRQAWTGSGSGRELPQHRSERVLAQAASKVRTARNAERVVIKLM